jgi:hypothetical protein
MMREREEKEISRLEAKSVGFGNVAVRKSRRFLQMKREGAYETKDGRDGMHLH